MKIISLVPSPVKSARDPRHERCPACGSLKTERLRVLADDDSVVSWLQCSACDWSQAASAVQFEFGVFVGEDGPAPESEPLQP